MMNRSLPSPRAAGASTGSAAGASIGPAAGASTGPATGPSPGRRPFARSATAALAALLLAGCANLRPGTAPAPVSAQPGVPERLPVAAAAEDTVLPSWGDWLAGDAGLQRLVDTALAHNRDLRVAVLNVQRAQAQWQAADASRWPVVGVGVGAQRAPNGQGQQANTLTAGLSLASWELDLFGRLAALSEAARADWLATQAGQRSVALAVTAQVVQMGLALRADEQLLALAQRTLASRQDTLRLVRLREQAGAASALELHAQQGLVAQAQATLAQLQRQRAQDENALALLLGQPLLPALFDPAAAPPQLAQLREVPVGLSSQVLRRRPDVVQAEQQLLAARANLAAARAALWPSISLTGQAGQASAQLSGLFQGGHFAYTAAANLLFTVFDAGRRQAGIAAAGSTEAIALAQYERAVQAAFRDTADALAGVATWRAQQAALQDGLQAARSTQRLVALKLQHGAASALELQEAERGLWQAEQGLVQARLAELSAQVALYRALAP